MLLVVARMGGAAWAQDVDALKERYAAYALANAGDALAGEKLYNTNKQLLCATCHSITGLEKCGPNLDGIADKYPKRELVHHILNPSAFIQPGYEMMVYQMADGKTHVGRIRIVTKINYQLLDATSKRRNVNRAQVVSTQVSPVSMMPEGLVAAISEAEFADLVAYLGTLSKSEETGFAGKDEPVEIATLAQPVGFEPLRGEDAEFVAPVWLGNIPGVNQMAVVEHQHGRIWRLTRGANGEVKRYLFLDLSDEISPGNNTGLMGIAFHPEYAKNRKYYLEYEVNEGGKLITTIAERVARSDGLADSGRASRRLLAVEQPAGNHNGGCIDFGNDGMLYAGFGDGGPQLDPPGHSQNGMEFLGSFVRIDVDSRTGDLPYGIPADNPFVGREGYRPEVWAMGFREPWRFSFDRATGDLWVGDVG
ncbi:MAG: PQQ-dependent sugar dehydrogenase, partial [Planctomycetota bacterium]